MLDNSRLWLVRCASATTTSRALARTDVRENLGLGAYRCPDPEIIELRSERVLQRFPRLRARLSQLAGLLSGGEQQMLAMRRALMSGPNLLLLDDPSLGLSPLMSQAVLCALRQLCQHPLRS
ncbi:MULTISPECIES: ATP-binding cassette domain-containing protein [unclassified Bradyrhizobium]|uniref:ATP-binding cassette domain-containing protein n=1 Tax=unclassified Bradyrhizobium TaxID=2631580 RepID=UPI001FFBDD2C|nr:MULTISPECIES: ATP-binding cassette domain-containing protein [unclassified Bradyrhizobium]